MSRTIDKRSSIDRRSLRSEKIPEEASRTIKEMFLDFFFLPAHTWLKLEANVEIAKQKQSRVAPHPTGGNDAPTFSFLVEMTLFCSQAGR